MKNVLTLCLCSALAGGAATAATATTLGTQLLVNGDAESGSTAGWSSTGIDALAITNAVPGTAGLPAGVGLGRFVFTGGSGAAAGQSLSQTIDLAALAGAVDAGALTASFSVLVQSRSLDPGSGELRFLSGAGGRLASFSFADPVTAAFDWGLYSDTRVVPTGTRSIEVFLLAKRTSGVSSDAYFDNASLVLTSAVPEPGAAWLWSLGLPLLGAAARRRLRRC